jgi:hypothetical protein
MKRAVAIMLIALLVASPVPAGQKPNKQLDWQKLKAGMQIVLTVAGGETVTERVLFVDDAILVTRRAPPPKLPGRVETALVDAASYWRSILNAGTTYRPDSVRVSQDGIFDGDKKLAELTEVVRYTPRGDVLAISQAAHSHVGRNVAIITLLVIVVPIIFWSIVCSRGYGCT